LTGYIFGYELLILNGLITFAGLFIFKDSKYHICPPLEGVGGGLRFKDSKIHH
jgi:hypothetical protein